MEAVVISGMWWVVRREGRKVRVLDGPYQEWHWAVSMARLREID